MHASTVRLILFVLTFSPRLYAECDKYDFSDKPEAKSAALAPFSRRPAQVPEPPGQADGSGPRSGIRGQARFPHREAYQPNRRGPVSSMSTGRGMPPPDPYQYCDSLKAEGECLEPRSYSIRKTQTMFLCSIGSPSFDAPISGHTKHALQQLNGWSNS